MLIFNDVNDFELLEFYRYPTTVIERLCEWDEGFHPGGNKQIKRFFKECLKKAEEITGKRLDDNKIAIKILHKDSDTIFYVGYKDWNWCVGLKLNKMDIGNMIKLK